MSLFGYLPFLGRFSSTKAHKSYFFAAGATQKSTLHTQTVVLHAEKKY